MDTNTAVEMYSFKPFQFQLVKADQSSDLPAERSGHRIVCNSKYLYLYGGYNPEQEDALIVRDMWKFNFATRKWTLCTNDLPNAVTSAAVIRTGQQMLIYGGTGVPFGFSSSNRLHSIKLNGEINGVSTIETVGKQPQPMYGQAIVLDHDSLYTIGGTNGLRYTCDVHQINICEDTKVWRKLCPPENNSFQSLGRYIPEGRYRHEVGFDGKNIYVLGGGTCDEVLNLTFIPTFNIQSRTWQELRSRSDPKSNPPFPQARRCHGIVHLKSENDTYVFLLGGCQDTDLVYNDLWRLQLSTLQWTLVQNSVLPRGLYFHSTTVTDDGKMYVFGGIEEGGQLSRTNDMHAAWLRIPKLYEICWEAILHYCQNGTLSKEVLSKLKVPEHFIDRLE